MTAQIDVRVAQARAELEATLLAIEDKLNVPKRVSRCVIRAQTSFRRNPVPWLVGATVAAVGIAAVITWRVLDRD